MLKPYICLGGGLATLLFSACIRTADAPLEPSSSAVAEAVGGDLDNITPVHRFSISIRPSQLSKAGATSVFDITVRANVATPQAQIDVVFPEVERSKLAAQESAVGRSFHAASSVITALSAGGVQSIASSTAFPGPGLYRIAVSARATGNTTELVNGVPVSSIEYVEGWIYTDENGSRFSDSVSAGLVPDSVMVAPGPRHLIPSTTAPRSGLGSGRALNRPGPSDAGEFLLGDCDQYRVLYYNGNTLTYQIVPGVSAFGSITEDQTGQEVGTINTGTDQTGDFYVCTNQGTGYFGQVELVSNDFLFETPLIVAGFGGGESNGYYSELISTQSSDTWFFLSLGTAKQTAQTQFGYSRGQLKVKVTPNSQSNIKYSINEDRVYLDRTSAFDQYYGWFSPAHEYGHAYQEKALGGIPGNNCPNPHYLNVASSLSCAYVEGWADFFAGFIRGDLLVATSGSDYKFEHNAYYPAGGADGSVIEGPVAAFFYDLVDGPSSPDGVTNGTDGDDDSVLYPASYLAQIIKTCQVLSGATWIRPNGVDHVIYCLEQAIDTAITGSPTYFPTRSPDPSAYTESATEPSGWSQAAIRALWKNNLYGQ